MKQEDITMLLRINKRQWAMHEIGQRGLPLDAQLKLAEMLAFIKQPYKRCCKCFFEYGGTKRGNEKTC